MHLPFATGAGEMMWNGGGEDENADGAFMAERARVMRGNEETWVETDEIDAILDRTFNANKRPESVPRYGYMSKRKKTYESSRYNNTPVTVTYKPSVPKDEYLLVDGYNIIFAWEDLKALADINIDSARGKLQDILCNYQAIRGCNLIVVYDAYRVQGHDTEISDYHNIHVVFTREAETADQYIEKFAHENAKKYRVTVATSDGLEQIIIRGAGCGLISARELEEEVKRAGKQVSEEYDRAQPRGANYLFDHVAPEVMEQIEKNIKNS